jgi:hypothetical protein
MRLAVRPKPRTVTNRAEEARDWAVARAREVPEVLDTSRKRALAVAGAAASFAAGFAFGRSRHEETPSVHEDPAKPPTPWKMDTSPTERPPERDETKPANVAGSRSK